MVDKSFKVLGLYFFGLSVLFFLALGFWNDNRSLSFVLWFFFVIGLVQLFFGSKLASMATDLLLKYQ